MAAVVYAPTQIILSMVFLYFLLGWRYVPHASIIIPYEPVIFGSVFVGLGIMVGLSGLPGLVSKMMHGTQVARMKTVRWMYSCEYYVTDHVPAERWSCTAGH